MLHQVLVKLLNYRDNFVILPNSVCALLSDWNCRNWSNWKWIYVEFARAPLYWLYNFQKSVLDVSSYDKEKTKELLIVKGREMTCSFHKLNRLVFTSLDRDEKFFNRANHKWTVRYFLNYLQREWNRNKSHANKM